MAYLITPTLLNSLDWLNKCPPSWKDSAYKDILSTLNREPFVANAATQRGTDFENEVYALANKDPSLIESSGFFRQVCDRVKGYDYQHSIKVFIEVDGVEYVCYGRIDCFKPVHIIDIKTTANYKGPKQYLSGWQHKFYTAIPKIPLFTYLIAEWAHDYSIKAIHEVDYVATDFDAIMIEIKDGIRNFISYINFDEAMKDAYYNRYNRKR